jgi:hypothetical protein
MHNKGSSSHTKLDDALIRIQDPCRCGYSWSCKSFAGTVLVPHVVHALLLAGGELLVAAVDGVVHVVVDGVSTLLVGAGVTVGGAAAAGAGLSWGISDVVAVAIAATLESVEETWFKISWLARTLLISDATKSFKLTHEVADLVGGSSAQVVVGGRSSGDSGGEDTASVTDVVLGAGGEVVREVAVLQKQQLATGELHPRLFLGNLHPSYRQAPSCSKHSGHRILPGEARSSWRSQRHRQPSWS